MKTLKDKLKEVKKNKPLKVKLKEGYINVHYQDPFCFVVRREDGMTVKFHSDIYFGMEDLIKWLEDKM